MADIYDIISNTVMAQLPAALVCLTIEHVIDDQNAVEGLLAENPNAARCMPLALREVYGIPTLPNADTAFTYLNLLWSAQYITSTNIDKYYMAAKTGATYILPHIIDNPQRFILLDALERSSIDGHKEVAAHLIDQLDSKYPEWTAHIYLNTFSNLVKIKENDLLDYILERWIDTLTKHPVRIWIDRDSTFRNVFHDTTYFSNNAAIPIIVHAFRRIIPWDVMANVLNVERRRMVDTDAEKYHDSISAISDVLKKH